MQQRRSQFPRIVQHPAAPRMIPRPLPQGLAPISQQPVIVTPDNGQLLPTALLFQNDAVPVIDAMLSFHNRPRPVVRPAITIMPEHPEYLWGAVGSHVANRAGAVGIYFDDVPVPATNPLCLSGRCPENSDPVDEGNQAQRYTRGRSLSPFKLGQGCR